MCRRVLAATVLCGALVMGPAVRAEVSAETTADGQYVQMVFFTNSSAKKLKIWAVQNPRPLLVPLNENGDLNGDLWPQFVENTLDHNYPWVVWSRFNGSNYDLAYSRWFPGGWQDIRWVQDAGPTAGDDLDPSLTLDAEGRPYVAWWADENGVGRVYMSLFLVTRWMSAYPVSDADVDSRYPTITVREDGKIQVDFETPSGPETRVIVFNRPGTIVDDIEPFGVMSPENEGSGSDFGQ